MVGWLAERHDGIELRIRVTPKGGADRIDGTARLADGTDVLVARVKAAPEKGAANAAIERLIGRSLGVAPTRVSIVSGHKARLKTVHVATGAAPLKDILAALARPTGRKG